MSVVSKIKQNVLRNPKDDSTTTFEDLWKDQRCVIVFFRRWGWPYCRLAAREISAIQPLLKEHNVRLIGVGVEQFGVEEFIQENYFDGEVYVDDGKKSYQSLDFKTMTFLQLFPAVLSAAARAAQASAKALGLGGNMDGDKWQLGGCVVVEKGGVDKPLLYYIQQSAPDHVSNADVLKSLSIEGDAPVATPVQKL